MTDLKTILMSSVAAISLAAAPALAQETAPTETEGAETQQQMTETAPAERTFEGTYGENLAGLGDRNVEELVGTAVVNEAGETIGEVDNFGLSSDQQIVAIVGIGGFLGMGEHSVALPLDSLSFDGEQLVLAGITREELEAMPEYDEGDAQTFAADQTLRGGYEGMGQGTGAPGMTTGTEPTDTAAVQPSEDPAADQPMADAEAEVAADAEAEADSETTVEEQVAEGEVEQVGEDVAQATEQAAEQTGDAVEEAGEEMAQTAEGAGESMQGASDEAVEETAEATDQAESEAEQIAQAPGTETQEGGEPQAETEMTSSEEAQPSTEGTETAATDQSAEPVAEGTETAATDQAAEPMADETETAAAEGSGWTEEMDTIFADIADRQIAELIGMDVASAEGEVVGQVDNFALSGEDVVAIVGVGGFLGIGEHEVALPLNDMTFDGERLVLSSLTEDQLREMPEYDEAGANYLPGEGTLRSTYE